MLTMLSITTPLFLLILVGYLLIRFQVIPREALPGMSRYVLYLALPVLIFLKISQMDLGTIIDPDYMLVYATALLGSFFLVFGISRFLQGDSTGFAGLKAFGGSFPNSAFIGLPILLQYFESPPAQAFVMTLLVENILLFPIAFALMETSGEHNPGLKKLLFSVTERVVKHPIIIAVVAGILFSLSGLGLPGFLVKGMEMLSVSAAPVALIIIGGSLAGTAFTAKYRDVMLIAGAKLVVQPLLVILMLLFLVPDLDPVLKQAAVIFCAAPMMSMFPIIGGQYGHQSWCSGVLLVTTLLAFFSVTLMLSLVAVI